MKLLLAGSENPTSYKVAAKFKAPNVLMSYWYLRKKSAAHVKELLERSKELGMWIMLDSGTHSWYMQYKYFDPRKMAATVTQGVDDETDEEVLRLREMSDDEFAAYKADRVEKARPEADSFVRGLIDFVQEYKPYFDAYAELDVDAIFGYDTVLKWRKWWWEANLAPIVTIHSSQDRDQQFDTLAWAVRYGDPYVGLEAGWRKENYSQWFTDFRAELEKDKIKVHGWAMTTIHHILRVPFYSVDSSTWTSGQRYGMTYVYQPGSLQMKSYDRLQKDRIRPQLVAAVQQLDLDAEKFLADDDGVVADYNGAQWVALSRELEAYNTNAYWLTRDERTQKLMADADKWGTRTAIVRRQPNVDLPALSGSPQAMMVNRYCNTCVLSGRCPEFAPDSTCTLSQVRPIQSQTELNQILMTVLAIQAERVQFGYVAERVMGQPMSEATSKEIDRLAKLAEKVTDMQNPKKGPSFAEMIIGGIAAGTAGATAAARQNSDSQPGTRGVLAGIFGTSAGGHVGTRKESAAVQQTFKAAQAYEAAAEEADLSDTMPVEDGFVETVLADNKDDLHNL